jgi:protein SCO1
MGTADLHDPPAADPTAEQRPGGGKRFDPGRLSLAALVLAVVVGGVVLLLSGGGGKAVQSHPPPSTAKSASFAGGIVTPSKPAPALDLRNYTGGARVNVASFRGKALLVTFVYAHCPDVCPLIISNLGIVQRLLGTRASKTQIVAVSVDPRGDTRPVVAKFLKERGMSGRMLYLTGSAHELGRVWSAWGVGSERDAKDPEFVDHSAAVYGVDASGRWRTVYLGDTWKPSEIAHDAPLLAAQ